MNYPQCQERLDERLDGLRSGLQSGALSPSDARTQAQSALEESVRECSDGEAQLRAHTNLRLALMIAVPDEVQAVPPALRANVRRALEREARPLVAGSWRPVMNFAWTGGALLSALGLFLVARPFLLERAQSPLMTSAAPSSSSDAASESAMTPAAMTPAAMTPAAMTPAAKPKAIVPAPAAKLPAGRSSSSKAPAPKSEQPQVVLPPPLTQAAPANKPNKQKSSSRFEIRVPSPRPESDAEERNLSRSSVPPAPRPPQRIAPLGSGIHPLVKERMTPRSSSPSATPTASLPVSGAELGLTVRFVPAPSALQQRSRTGAGGSASFVQPPRVGSSAPPSPGPVQKPAPSTPANSVGAPPSQEAPDEANDSRPVMGRRSLPSEDVEQNNASSSAPDKNTEASSQNLSSTPTVGGTLSVSVEHAVTNARIVGQIRGRKGESVELWSGNAAANQPISVSLAPLRPAMGDTVQVSVEQKLAGEKTKALATTSVVVP